MKRLGLTILAAGTGLAGLLFIARFSAAQNAPASGDVFAALYYRGGAWIAGKSAGDQPRIQEHVAHFQSLGDRLLGAATFAAEPPDPHGMVLLIAASEEAARKWAQADPAVRSGLFDVRVYPWHVSTVRGWSVP